MRRFVTAILLCVLTAGGVQAQTKRIPAADLQHVVRPGDKIDIVMRSGGRAEATAEQVKDTNILIKVTMTSNASEVPRGTVLVPLDTIAEVRICKMVGRILKVMHPVPRPEGPPVNRPGRQAGITIGMRI